MSEPVSIDIDAGVATVVLADPERRNALSSVMFDGLESALTAIESDASILVARMRAEGSAFCAGFDLPAMAEDRMLPEFLRRLGGLCRRIRGLDAIVVMEVQGPAVAGGCALVSAGDLVHACPGATFGYPVHRLGISPAVSLPTLMGGAGHGPARRLALSGQLLDAEAARRLGLVHSIQPDRGTLADAVEDRCRRLAGFDPNCVRATKRYLNELDLTDRSDRFEATLEASVETGRSEETHDRLEAALASMRDRTGR